MTRKKNTVAAAQAANKRNASGKTAPLSPSTEQGWLADRYVQNKETARFGDHPDDHPDDEDGA
ncbi:hypothetical protein ACFQ7N_38715 [Streptomyces niveus]|uniref:hypothetical protein n=1 Tax=Streptomyces niveus TaxID=193462 RepID=UPI0036C46D11